MEITRGNSNQIDHNKNDKSKTKDPAESQNKIIKAESTRKQAKQLLENPDIPNIISKITNKLNAEGYTVKNIDTGLKVFKKEETFSQTKEKVKLILNQIDKSQMAWNGIGVGFFDEEPKKAVRITTKDKLNGVISL